MKRPRMAWFSLLSEEGNVSSSQSAYASAVLLPKLEEQFEIDLFHDSFVKKSSLPARHFLEAFERHREKPYDLFFYQIEDRIGCNFVRMALALEPGAVYFHDAFLSTHGPEPVLNSSWEETIKRFHNPKHPWPARGEEFEQEEYFAARELGLSVSAIFSSERDFREYTRRCEKRLLKDNMPGLGAHFLRAPADPERAFRPRDWENSDPSKFKIGLHLPVGTASRCHKLLQACQGRWEDIQILCLLDEGELASAQEYFAEVPESSLQFRVLRSPETWAATLEELDLCMHCWHSVFQHPGSYLSLSLLAGKPCLVSKFGTTSFLPESIAFQISPGQFEAAEMGAVIDGLITGSISREQDLVRDYAREHMHVDAVARDLALVLREDLLRQRAFRQRWEKFQADARASLFEEISQEAPGGEETEQFLAPVFEELGWGKGA